MRLKICTKINNRYVYSQAWIEDWQLEHILDYVSNITDIEQYYKLCRSKTFELQGYEVIGIGTQCKVQTYNKRVFTGFSTVIFMDRNINYRTHSPFAVVVNAKYDKALPGYHSTVYEKELELARKALQ